MLYHALFNTFIAKEFERDGSIIEFDVVNYFQVFAFVADERFFDSVIKIIVCDSDVLRAAFARTRPQLSFIFPYFLIIRIILRNDCRFFVFLKDKVVDDGIMLSNYVTQ